MASQVGVSPMTVSRVLNKRPDVAPQTRERVERMIAQSGFVPARAANARREGRHGLIDLVVPALDTGYSLEIARGVEAALEPTGYRLVLSCTYSSSRDPAKQERTWLARLSQGKTDGAILVLYADQSRRLEALRRRHIPFVIVDPVGDLGPDVPSVGATNWAGARAATEYLLSLGHRRVGFIGGPPSLLCAEERLSGYRSALEAAGTRVTPELVRPGNFMDDVGYKQTLALMELAEPPTAIFAGSDSQALGAYGALRQLGKCVPDDVSVVGFDDTLVAPLVTPALTTVRQPLAEMGRFAVRNLLRVIEGRPLSSMRVQLATTLIIRGSCAPPGQGS
ncbi:MAG: LacI family DNA-binding transcriptional regulator [Actinomycetota bacterium]|nr:LacI family DNA-binding transcriptional regulator [Actinomycetota bacterium]